MSPKVTISGADAADGEKYEQSVISKNHITERNIPGAVVYTVPMFDTIVEVHPFLNPSFGNAMNQNVAFSGDPEVIFDGSLNGWTGTANIGAWSLSDSGKVTITGADNLDNAIWLSYAQTIDMNNFTAITGKVDLDVYDESVNAILLQFSLGGVDQGNSVDLNTFINTGDFTEQNFVIQKASFGIEALVVDELTITITRTGGAKPTIKFDDFQIEEIGDPLDFISTLDSDEVFCVNEIFLTIVNNTSANLAYDEFIGLPALTNGLVFSRARNGVVRFSVTVKQLSDFLGGGAVIVNKESDGTNTIVSMRIQFPIPLLLNGSTSDFLKFTVNDDLSSLLLFNATARGHERVDPTKNADV